MSPTACARECVPYWESLYDENRNLIGSNTVIFDLSQLTDEKILELEAYFRDSKKELDRIKESDYQSMDESSKSEYDGLEEMFGMLQGINLRELSAAY